MSFDYSTWGKSFGLAWGNSWGVAAQSARSGYWRLFFMQMQEEALKKDAEQKAAPTPEPAVVEPVAKVAPVKPRKKKKVVEAATEDPAPISNPKRFPRKPIYTSPSTYEQLANLKPLVYDRFALESVQDRNIINLEKERIKRRKQARRRAAAFLLMAA